MASQDYMQAYHFYVIFYLARLDGQFSPHSVLHFNDVRVHSVYIEVKRSSLGRRQQPGPVRATHCQDLHPWSDCGGASG